MDDNLNEKDISENPEITEDTTVPETTDTNNDDFVLGKGFEISEEASEVLPEKSGKNGVKIAVWISSIVILAVLIATIVIVATSEYLGIGFGRKGTCVVEIKQGMSTSAIAGKLKEAGAINSELCFRVFSRLKHYDGKYSYGVYTFNAETGYPELAQMLMTKGAKAETATVTIPEAATIEEMADILSEAGICTKTQFLKEVRDGNFSYDFIKEIPGDKLKYRLEGYLVPNTYNFYSNDSDKCAYLAIDKMLSAFNDMLTPEIKKGIEASGYSLHEIVSMASLVELEAGGVAEEMPNVSAVFYNRLKSSDFQTLGSSPTTKKKYNHGDDRYNTYVCAGLPVGPLCAINESALKAAISPTENFPFFYFVTDKSMKFYYNKTIDEHNAIIAKLKKDNNWIYETIE